MSYINQLVLETLEYPEPTTEMFKFYDTRTNKHIQYVQKNIREIIKNFSFNNFELQNRSKTHDASKFSKEEYIPYVWLTEYYRKKQLNQPFDYPTEAIEKQVDIAVQHHYAANPHHPEFYSNVEYMSISDIVEMVCDWAAMSQELKNSLRQFASKQIPKVYKFNESQQQLIYKLINHFEPET